MESLNGYWVPKCPKLFLLETLGNDFCGNSSSFRCHLASFWRFGVSLGRHCSIEWRHGVIDGHILASLVRGRGYQVGTQKINPLENVEWVLEVIVCDSKRHLVSLDVIDVMTGVMRPSWCHWACVQKSTSSYTLCIKGNDSFYNFWRHCTSFWRHAAIMVS